MSELRYTLEGRPVSWQRTNVVRGRLVTDAGQRVAKRAHSLAAAAAMRIAAPWRGLEGVFEVEVRSYYPNGVQGDIDRLAGIPLDALEGITYKADRQVKRLMVTVAIDRERPRTEVVVRRIGFRKGEEQADG